MRYLIFIAVVVLAGCATTRAYEEVLEGWKGKNGAELQAKWGEPNRRHQFGDGSSALEYRFSDRSKSEEVRRLAGEAPGCVTVFALSPEGEILTWKWQGHDCVVK